MKLMMKKIILAALVAIVLLAAASIWLGGSAIPPCALPNGASAISRLDDAPPALVRALVERVGEVAPAGAKFDDPIFPFDMSQDRREAIFLQERIAFPESVCSTASSLLALRNDERGS